MIFRVNIRLGIWPNRQSRKRRARARVCTHYARYAITNDEELNNARTCFCTELFRQTDGTRDPLEPWNN